MKSDIGKEMEEFIRECNAWAKKVGLTKEDSRQILYQVRHPEWDQVNAQILMLMFQWLEYCEWCYKQYDLESNDFCKDNFYYILNWIENYRTYGVQE